jgi:hypothetical protein
MTQCQIDLVSFLNTDDTSEQKNDKRRKFCGTDITSEIMTHCRDDLVVF